MVFATVFFADVLLGSYDRGALNTNALFASSGIFYRDCRSCAATHQKIYYKRITPVPAGFSIYDQMVTTWSSTNNVLNTDFKLYSSYYDMMNGTNAWSFCNYDTTAVAFPGDCGPSEAVGGQWNSNTGGQANYRFYVADTRVLAGETTQYTFMVYVQSAPIICLDLSFSSLWSC